MEQKDYYQILKVDPQSSPKQIKEAYRNLAFEYHPDRNRENPESAENMKKVNEAYAVLSHPQKRREYDAMRHQFGSSAYSQFRKNYSDQDIFSGSDIHNIFEEMTRAFGLRGFDEIFKEFYGSDYRTFEFKKPGISGWGFVFFGKFGRGGMPKTHLPLPGMLGKLSRFVLKQISGTEFPEKGTDINEIIHLDYQYTDKGGPYAYFHKKKKKKLVVQIPPGVRDGQKIRLAGMGADGKDGGESGDLFLRVKIRKPLLMHVKNFLSRGRK
jgi:DnaJ-class molecular chaperone